MPKVQRNDVPLDRVRVFHLFSSMCNMLQVSVSLIPVTEADAFLAVPYCLTVTLFFFFASSGSESTATVVLYWEQPKVSHLPTLPKYSCPKAAS